MRAARLIKNIGSLATVGGQGQAKSGKSMGDIAEIQDAAILFDEKILWVGSNQAAEQQLNDGTFKPIEVIDAGGRAILPGFVDSHTHIVFAGDRADEFARRARGVSYTEIAAEGGGILRTMQAVRNSNAEEMAAMALPRIWSAINHGSTTLEVKSGYGLDMQSELNQLRAIKILQQELPIELVPTFMGAHDFPPEYRDNREEYMRIVCEEMIPTVAKEGLAEYCDVFTDEGYYTLEQSERIFAVAAEHGLKARVHADEFVDVGGAAMAARSGCVSADHLLKISDSGAQAMRQAGVVATLLPGTAYFLSLPYAPARRLIDADLIVALATDCNPGSCFTENMQLIINMACTQMRMSLEEAINAATINGAAALERADKIGSIEVGKQANFCVAGQPSYKQMVYHFGINHIEQVWVKGRKIA